MKQDVLEVMPVRKAKTEAVNQRAAHHLVGALRLDQLGQRPDVTGPRVRRLQHAFFGAAPTGMGGANDLAFRVAD